jgi:predicted Fe-S protein YdhL (DUF1289 family)
MPSAFDMASAKGPMSPCISICALGVDGHCSGCLRTRDEIAGWLRMSAAEQWALIRELDRRREVRDGPPR